MAGGGRGGPSGGGGLGPSGCRRADPNCRNGRAVTQADGREERLLKVHRGAGRTSAGQAIAAARYVHGTAARAAYLRAIVLPTRAVLDRRSRWRRGLRVVLDPEQRP